MTRASVQILIEFLHSKVIMMEYLKRRPSTCEHNKFYNNPSCLQNSNGDRTERLKIEFPLEQRVSLCGAMGTWLFQYEFCPFPANWGNFLIMINQGRGCAFGIWGCSAFKAVSSRLSFNLSFTLGLLPYATNRPIFLFFGAGFQLGRCSCNKGRPPRIIRSLAVYFCAEVCDNRPTMEFDSGFLMGGRVAGLARGFFCVELAFKFPKLQDFAFHGSII